MGKLAVTFGTETILEKRNELVKQSCIAAMTASFD